MKNVFALLFTAISFISYPQLQGFYGAEICNESYDFSIPDNGKYSINFMWMNPRLCTGQGYLYPARNEAELYDTFLKNIFTWAKENHRSGVMNVWYDGRTLSPLAIQRTQNAIQAYAKENKSQAPIILRDVRELPSVKENPFILSDELPVYFRVDLTRAIILDNCVRHEKDNYAVYADLDMEPLFERELFDEDTVYKLKKYGGVMVSDPEGYGFENGFQMMSSHQDSLLEAMEYAVIDLNIERAKNALVDGYFLGPYSSSELEFPMEGIEQAVYGSYFDAFKYLHHLDKRATLMVTDLSDYNNKGKYEFYDKLKHGLKPFGLKRVHPFSFDFNNENPIDYVPTKKVNIPKSHFSTETSGEDDIVSKKCEQYSAKYNFNLSSYLMNTDSSVMEMSVNAQSALLKGKALPGSGKLLTINYSKLSELKKQDGLFYASFIDPESSSQSIYDVQISNSQLMQDVTVLQASQSAEAKKLSILMTHKIDNQLTLIHNRTNTIASFDLERSGCYFVEKDSNGVLHHLFIDIKVDEKNVLVTLSKEENFKEKDSLYPKNNDANFLSVDGLINIKNESRCPALMFGKPVHVWVQDETGRELNCKVILKNGVSKNSNENRSEETSSIVGYVVEKGSVIVSIKGNDVVAIPIDFKNGGSSQTWTEEEMSIPIMIEDEVFEEAILKYKFRQSGGRHFELFIRIERASLEPGIC